MTSTVNGLLFCLHFFSALSAAKEVTVTVDDKNVIATVSESFHGVAFDASLFSPDGLWSFVDITSQKLVTLLKGLSPGYFRVGGTFANWLFFDLQPNNKWYNYWPFQDKTPKTEGITTGWLFRKPNKLPKETFDQLIDLTRKSNMRLLFDLNAEVRTNGKWDSSEAIKLFDYCVDKKYGENIDWELGNEPNHITAHNLTKEEVGQDFKDLYDLLQKPKYTSISKGSLVGPDVGWMGVEFIRGLADAAGEHITAFTIHQYYFNGNTSKKETYLDVSYFEKLQLLFNKVKNVLKGSKHIDKPIWLGETSSGYSSGTKDVSDRYVSGFLTLDKLGLSAVNNVKVVIRQTLYNGYYGLLDKDNLDPNPDYWLMHVHNTLVGNKVFKVDISDKSNKTRVYVQCTKVNENGSKYKKGALTIFALNLEDEEVTFKLNNYGGKSVHSYVLSPGDGGDITSKKVLLNKVELKLETDTKLPVLKENQNQGSVIKLPSQRFGFFVITDAEVTACR